MKPIKIYYKLFDPECDFEINDYGEMIDLHIRGSQEIQSPTYRAVNQHQKERTVDFGSVTYGLGVAMKMPRGLEAHIQARSGTFSKYGIILTNGVGEIDSSYSGDNDEWKANFLCTRKATIPDHARLVQFKIQPGMFCPWRTWLRYIFKGVEFIQVPKLPDEDRGGFGTTGI